MSLSNLPGKRPALVVVHMQNDLIGDDGPFRHLYAEQLAEQGTVEKVSKLADLVRSNDGVVVWARLAWRADYADMFTQAPILQSIRDAGALVEGTPGADFVDGIEPHPDDIIHTHRKLGGFTNSLDAILRSKEVDTVLFCGVGTNVSMASMARQAADDAYRVVMIADACVDYDTEIHESILESLRLVSLVATSDELHGIVGR